MTDSLPPFAEPYVAEFQKLLRILERTPGFLLQPVDGPSPDLAQAFAAWATEAGWSVEVLVLDEEGVTRLQSLLTLSRVRPDPCLYVVAAGRPREAALEHALAGLNMARDTVIAQLHCPLLWWGDADFLRTTGLSAPDLWSVAAVPFRLPYRRLQDTMLPLSACWWTGAVHTPLSVLEGEVAEARQSADPVMESRAGLRLAEARLARKDVGGAAEILTQLDPVVTSASALRGRWEMLRRATSDAADAAEADVEELRAKLHEAEASGHQRRAIGLRLRLGPLLESSDVNMAVALYLDARRDAAELGDVRATVEIDLHLIYDLVLFVPEEDREQIREYARGVPEKTSDPDCLRNALLIRAKLALMRSELQRAERLAQEALAVGDTAAPNARLGALCILAQVALRRGDLAHGIELATDWLATAKACDSSQLMMQAHLLRAEGLSAMNRPVEAAQDLFAALNIVIALDQELAVDLLVGRLAQSALAHGDTWVAASLAATAAIGGFFSGVTPLAIACPIDPDDLDFGETADVAANLREILTAESRLDEGQRPATLQALQASADHVRTLLDADGVDPADPTSWRQRQRSGQFSR